MELGHNGSSGNLVPGHEGLEGGNQHLELDSEANQQQVHLTQHGCYMDNSTREPRTTHPAALLRIVSKCSPM